MLTQFVYNILTFFAVEFSWTDIIKIVSKQFGEDLTNDAINNMSWKTKVLYLKRNTITIARQIDYRFNQLWSGVRFSYLNIYLI